MSAGEEVSNKLVEQANASRASKIKATEERFFNTCKVIRIKPLSA
jgi:hypothetical protein